MRTRASDSRVSVLGNGAANARPETLLSRLTREGDLRENDKSGDGDSHLYPLALVDHWTQGPQCVIRNKQGGVVSQVLHCRSDRPPIVCIDSVS
ncbi:hypothetical protein OPQ81_001777 [Rhizoctonia solani]|nr:hypothetical protein OPQ81_001777 [Rhizoctonia solani]